MRITPGLRYKLCIESAVAIKAHCAYTVHSQYIQCCIKLIELYTISTNAITLVQLCIATNHIASIVF